MKQLLVLGGVRAPSLRSGSRLIYGIVQLRARDGLQRSDCLEAPGGP